MSLIKDKLGNVCSKITAGGDKPKIFSELPTNTCFVPIYSNGIDEEGLYGFTNKAKYNGDVITITGRGANAGTVFYRKEPFLPIIRLLTLIPKYDVIEARYLYYLLKGKSFLSTGSAQPQITVPNIELYEIEYEEDLEIQKKIISILSAYDDLIEVNRKQIKLLEEAAERLYREWFIDLHFPGHENTPIIDGLPQGWKIEKIGKSFDLYLGGTPARNNANFWEGGTIPWINSGAVNQSRIIEGNELITELAVEKSATKLLPKHCTLVAITGATLGQVSFNEIETCANQSVVAIKDRTNVFDEYMLLFIKHNITSIINKANGSAQQHINKGILEDFEIIIPSDIVIKTYHERVKLLNDKICNLLLQNKNLAAARDLLLPSLMNGEINL